MPTNYIYIMPFRSQKNLPALSLFKTEIQKFKPHTINTLLKKEMIFNFYCLYCSVMQLIIHCDKLGWGRGWLCFTRRKNDNKLFDLLEALGVLLYFSPQNLNDVYRLDLIYMQHKHTSTGNLDSQSWCYGLMSQQHRIFTSSILCILDGMYVQLLINPDTQETSAKNIFMWLLPQ